MIDARAGFAKDGAKNRLREQDIRRVFDTWETLVTLESNGTIDDSEIFPHFARFVPYSEITNERNDCNLNVTRYISPAETEVQHNLYAHLKLSGGLPAHDVEDGLQPLWKHCPSLKEELFSSLELGFYHLNVDKNEIRNTISSNREFRELNGLFSVAMDEWFELVSRQMFALEPGCKPKELIADWGESLLETVGEVNGMVDAYDIYDILLRYWNSTMQDDCYLISREGWKAELSCQVLTTDKKSKEVKFVQKKNPTFRDYDCDLLPVYIVVDRYFKTAKDKLQKAEELVAQLSDEIAQMEEEYPDELNGTVAEIRKAYNTASCPKPRENEKEILTEYLAISGNNKAAKEARAELIAKHQSIFAIFDAINAAKFKARVKEIEEYAPLPDDALAIYKEYLEKSVKLKDAKDEAKAYIAELTQLVVEKYPKLTEEEIKTMVVKDKWHAFIVGEAINEAFQVPIALEEQITALVDRYERRLSDISESVKVLESKVSSHLAKMGFEL